MDHVIVAFFSDYDLFHSHDNGMGASALCQDVRMALKDGIVLLDGVYNFKTNGSNDVHMTCSQLLTSSSRITLATWGKNIHHHDSQVRSVTSSQIHQKYAHKKRNSKKTIYKASKWQSLNETYFNSQWLAGCHVLGGSGWLMLAFVRMRPACRP